ncbi:MAG: dihydrodipicolinate synthase family protein [Sphaerochaetaceae bacterium]
MINFDVLENLIEYQIKSGVEGFYCCGSSVEALLLSIEERRLLARQVIRIVDAFNAAYRLNL